MITRSEIRNACYRAKKGVVQESQQHLLDMVQPLLSEKQTWSNFPKEWDVMVKGNEVKIIKPETDYDYIHNTLLEAALYDRQGLGFESFDDRQLNIISMVDMMMLDGIMSWSNYNKTWGVVLDPELKQLSTTLYNVKTTQIKVTDEMIVASMKDADGNPLTEQKVTETKLEMKPMDAAMSKAFEEFLSKKNKG